MSMISYSSLQKVGDQHASWPSHIVGIAMRSQTPHLIQKPAITVRLVISRDLTKTARWFCFVTNVEPLQIFSANTLVSGQHAAVPTTKKGPRLAIPQDLGCTDAAVISEVGTLIIHQDHVLQSQCGGAVATVQCFFRRCQWNGSQ